ncbi:MAG: 1-acyl-sn-glycerol-3-phosphate acyltransferase [Porticoccaceae bacterium]
MSDSDTLDEFHDIRPYNDDEVPGVIARLMGDRELLDTLLSIRHPVLFRYFAWAIRPWLRKALHQRFDAIRSVDDLQMLIGEQMELMLKKSATPATSSGLDGLAESSSHLFISNHRDIAMDPAFVNLTLFKHGLDTVRIAIGDNLLSKPFATDLMRLNKSFIVKRSVTGRREKLNALTKLSRYIRHSILRDGVSIWIAQREGRAKDGVDRTETALLKMLGLGKEKGQTFQDAIAELNVVPVVISYMFDPCDLDKARELHQRRTTGTYKKMPHEDLTSLYKGIVGYKGAVHVAYGKVVTATADDEALARQIDRQIIANYWLHPTNLIAWERLNGPDPRVASLKATFTGCDWHAVEQQLMARVAGETEAVRQIFLECYANPVQSRFDLEAGTLCPEAPSSAGGAFV